MTIPVWVFAMIAVLLIGAVMWSRWKPAKGPYVVDATGCFIVLFVFGVWALIGAYYLGKASVYWP